MHSRSLQGQPPRARLCVSGIIFPQSPSSKESGTQIPLINLSGKVRGLPVPSQDNQALNSWGKALGEIRAQDLTESRCHEVGPENGWSWVWVSTKSLVWRHFESEAMAKESWSAPRGPLPSYATLLPLVSNLSGHRGTASRGDRALGRPVPCVGTQGGLTVPP